MLQFIKNSIFGKNIHPCSLFNKNSFKFPQCFISPITCREANNGNHQLPRFQSHLSLDDDADNRKLHLAPSSTVTILFFTEITLFCTGIKDLVRKSLVEYSVQVQIQNQTLFVCIKTKPRVNTKKLVFDCCWKR